MGPGDADLDLPAIERDEAGRLDGQRKPAIPRFHGSGVFLGRREAGRRCEALVQERHVHAAVERRPEGLARAARCRDGAESAPKGSADAFQRHSWPISIPCWPTPRSLHSRGQESWAARNVRFPNLSASREFFTKLSGRVSRPCVQRNVRTQRSCRVGRSPEKNQRAAPLPAACSGKNQRGSRAGAVGRYESIAPAVSNPPSHAEFCSAVERE